MNRRFAIPLTCLLLSGCGLHHRLPLYADYKRIELGVPPPVDIQDNAQWGTHQQTQGRWSTGMEEEASYLLGSDGEVIAKGHRASGERGSLLFLWYMARKRSEAQVLVPTGTMTSDADILKVIRTRYRQLWHDDDDQDASELFRLAEETGGLAGSRFGVRRRTITKVFPLMEGTVLELKRANPESFHFLAEDRRDISLVVWTLCGWTGMLIGAFP